ncbi:hypothetical protein HPP92_007581 [Vanilla planifolia]|uniref:Uncharacterized protein n=1 Tax=Vanilla planifolia TaxID=51239 RepID=A0A835VAT3_VANPL|nr:hypothetical protein HPP92_007581 [Vanilla planifolia]
MEGQVDAIGSGTQSVLVEVIDFLSSLPSRYPNQSHVFLCGNHDFAFAAFVGALPQPPDGSPMSATWAEFEHNKDREGWFRRGYERMHVREGDGVDSSVISGISKEHALTRVYLRCPTTLSLMAFLMDLKDSVWIDHSEGRICCKLIAVHAGLEKSKSVDEQLKFLKAKDTSIPKVEDLSGRHNVWEIPQWLQKEQVYDMVKNYLRVTKTIHDALKVEDGIKEIELKGDLKRGGSILMNGASAYLRVRAMVSWSTLHVSGLLRTKYDEPFELNLETYLKSCK